MLHRFSTNWVKHTTRRDDNYLGTKGICTSPNHILRIQYPRQHVGGAGATWSAGKQRRNGPVRLDVQCLLPYSILRAHTGPHCSDVCARSVAPQQLWQVDPSNNTWSSFETSRWNILQHASMKHLKYASKTLKENTWKHLKKAIAKHIRHSDKTYNTQVKTYAMSK
jgi:hypothetical protein